MFFFFTKFKNIQPDLVTSRNDKQIKPSIPRCKSHRFNCNNRTADNSSLSFFSFSLFVYEKGTILVTKHVLLIKNRLASLYGFCLHILEPTKLSQKMPNS